MDARDVNKTTVRERQSTHILLLLNAKHTTTKIVILFIEYCIQVLNAKQITTEIINTDDTSLIALQYLLHTTNTTYIRTVVRTTTMVLGTVTTVRTYVRTYYCY